MKLRIKGRSISKGEALGRAIVTKEPISFLGSVDPKSGKIIERDHELYGKTIKNKVLIFPHGKGSTVGSYVLYQLRQNYAAPAAIVNRKCEPVIAVGAIISNIPLVDSLEIDPIEVVKNNALIYVNGTDGYIEIRDRDRDRKNE
jgi:predicted aconitase with swiveling domain